MQDDLSFSRLDNINQSWAWGSFEIFKKQGKNGVRRACYGTKAKVIKGLICDKAVEFVPCI